MKNIDNIKQKLYETKNSIAKNLSKEEEEEVVIFIDELVSNLQNKFKKIDYDKLSENVKKILKRNIDV